LLGGYVSLCVVTSSVVGLESGRNGSEALGR
jgi:hypothetical protein